MTDHALTCKILRAWYSIGAAYPSASTDKLASLTARRCHVSIERVLRAIEDPLD